MCSFIKKNKNIFIIGIIFFFSAASGFAYVKPCCHMEKMEEDHSCCAKKDLFNYKQTSKCECKISVPRDFVFENKNIKNSLNVQYSLSSLYLNDSSKYFLPEGKNVVVIISFKKHLQKIFLENCALLL